MNPITAIEGLDDMMGNINRKMSHLRTEVDEITEAWEGLGRVSGQREDHAAELLYRLERHFSDIAEFAARCHKQVIDMKDDPFDRKNAGRSEYA
jgi:hypothetical protein